MEVVQIDASSRVVTGKKVKALRKTGLTPIHIYGKARESKALQADAKSLQKILLKVGKNRPVSIVQGAKDSGEVDTVAFVREVQRHPVSGHLLHVDFYLVSVKERMTAEVPVLIVGEAPAMKVGGGILIHALHTLDVECLPMDVPEEIRVDISSLDDFEKVVRVADISVAGNVTILNDPDEMIAKVNPPRMEEEVKAEVAAPEEGAEGAEGEAKAEEGAAAGKAEDKKEG